MANVVRHELFQEIRLCFVSKWKPLPVWRWVSRDMMIPWSLGESGAGHCVHIAFPTLREKEISVHCAVVSMASVSLLFC